MGVTAVKEDGREEQSSRCIDVVLETGPETSQEERRSKENNEFRNRVDGAS